MRLSMIAAMAKNRVIGKDNAMPWHLPADLKHFKALTLGKPVLMGRKTFESIGKPLPGRTNIILTHNPDYSAPGCQIVTSINEAIQAATAAEELMIMGGANIYNLFLPKAERLYLTFIDLEVTGDACFPAWDVHEWQETSRQDFEPDANNPYRYSFVTMDRISHSA